MDVGAEAFVLRRPEMPALLAELGLSDRQQTTTGVRPLIYSGQRLHPLPSDTVAGIPSSAASVAGLVDDATVARIEAEPARAAELAARAAIPRWPSWWPTGSASRWWPVRWIRCWAGCTRVRRRRSGCARPRPSVAAALDRGATSLTDAVRQRLAAGHRRTGVRRAGGRLPGAARRTRRAQSDPLGSDRGGTTRPGGTSGWTLRDDTGVDWHADAVILAVPAAQVARLVPDLAPRTAAAARRIASCLVGGGGARGAGRHGVPAVLGCAGGQRRTAARQGDHAVVAQMGRGRGRATAAAVVRAVRRRPGRPRVRRRAAGLGVERPGRRVRSGRRTRSMPACSAGSTRCRSTDPATPIWSPNCARGCPRRLAVAGSYLDGIGVPACVGRPRQGRHQRRRGVGGRKWHDRCHVTPRLRRPERNDSLPDVFGVLGAAR